MLEPREIIQAFDAVREYVFGYALGRDNPHKDDAETAKSWIASGLTLVVAVMVFYEQMNWMHEKFLRFGEGKDRSFLPSSLKVFNENIEAAIRKSKGGGEIDEMEREMSKWRARVKGWKKNPAIWNHEQWGAQPFQIGNRVPKQILREFVAP